MPNTFNAERTVFASITQWNGKTEYAGVVFQGEGAWSKSFNGEDIACRECNILLKLHGKIYLKPDNYTGVCPSDYIITTYPTFADRTAKRNGTVSVMSEAEYGKSEWRKIG